MIDRIFHARRLSGLLRLRLKREQPWASSLEQPTIAFGRGRGLAAGATLPDVGQGAGLALTRRLTRSLKSARAVRIWSRLPATNGTRIIITISTADIIIMVSSGRPECFCSERSDAPVAESGDGGRQIHGLILFGGGAGVDKLGRSRSIRGTARTWFPPRRRGSFDRLASNNGAIFGAFTYEGLRGNGPD